MVLKEARAKLRALQPIAARMNEVSDMLRDEIKEIEDELAKLNIGVAVTLGKAFDESTPREEAKGEVTGDDNVPVYEHRLSYRRFGSGWRLVTVEYRCVQRVVQEWNNIVPLVEAPREMRIAAAVQIPELLDELKRIAEERIAAVSRVTDATK